MREHPLLYGNSTMSSINLSDPAWQGWEDVKEKQPLVWKKNEEYSVVNLEECFIGERMVAWVENRPYYCDRGHFKVNSNLPGLDSHDSFPRYYMKRDVAMAETEAWLRWRLWRIP